MGAIACYGHHTTTTATCSCSSRLDQHMLLRGSSSGTTLGPARVGSTMAEGTHNHIWD